MKRCELHDELVADIGEIKTMLATMSTDIKWMKERHTTIKIPYTAITAAIMAVVALLKSVITGGK